MGCPELGSVSLSELESVRGRPGLPIERDLYFKAEKSLSAYADEARRKAQSWRRGAVMTTNITFDHRAAFEALASGECANFALSSCFVNGKPAAAICAVHRDGDDYVIAPLFVSVTPSLELTDHDGREPQA